MNSALKTVLTSSSGGPQSSSVTSQINKAMHQQNQPSTYSQPSTNNHNIVNLQQNVTHNHPNPAHQQSHYSLNVPNAQQYSSSTVIPSSNHPVANIGQIGSGQYSNMHKNIPYTGGGYQQNLGNHSNQNPLPPVSQTLPPTQIQPAPVPQLDDKPQPNGTSSSSSSVVKPTPSPTPSSPTTTTATTTSSSPPAPPPPPPPHPITPPPTTAPIPPQPVVLLPSPTQTSGSATIIVTSSPTTSAISSIITTTTTTTLPEVGNINQQKSIKGTEKIDKPKMDVLKTTETIKVTEGTCSNLSSNNQKSNNSNNTVVVESNSNNNNSNNINSNSTTETSTNNDNNINNNSNSNSNNINNNNNNSTINESAPLETLKVSSNDGKSYGDEEKVDMSNIDTISSSIVVVHNLSSNINVKVKEKELCSQHYQQTTLKKSLTIPKTSTRKMQKNTKNENELSPKSTKTDTTQKLVTPKLPVYSVKSKRTRIKTQPYQSPLPEIEIITKISSTSRNRTNDEKLIVFYKNEFLAVRNSEGSFYVCQTVQNIYKSSPKIRIRWLSQDKNEKSGEIYTPDFYDHTDFDCILTNLNLERVDKGQYRLPPSEKIRTDSILKRSLAVEKGEVTSQSLTEEHPDGIDLSLYKEESQLKKKKKGIKRRANSSMKSDINLDVKNKYPDQSKIPKINRKITKKSKIIKQQPSTSNNQKSITQSSISRTDRAKRRSEIQNYQPTKVSPIVDQKKAKALAKVARKTTLSATSTTNTTKIKSTKLSVNMATTSTSITTSKGTKAKTSKRKVKKSSRK